MLYTRRYGSEAERPGMKAMTLNDIFEAILNISELQNLNCGRRVGRKGIMSGSVLTMIPLDSLGK